MQEFEKPTPEYAKTLLSFLPRRVDYETWIKIISAIGNSFDEQTALNIILSYWRDEKQNETLEKIKSRLKTIQFGTLVYYAKLNGYKGETLPRKSIPEKHSDFLKRQIQKEEQRNIEIQCQIPQTGAVYYKWNADEEMYYQLAVKDSIENDGLSKYDSEIYWTKKFSESECISKGNERLFDIMLNKELINKPEQSIIRANQHKFYYYRVTQNELIDYVSKGYAVLPSVLETKDGKFQRKNENWSYSDMIVLDIDHNLTIDECMTITETSSALFLYTSANHTNENHRFRIIFALPSRIENPTEYKEVYRYYSKLYGADVQCKDLARFYFGNNNTTIYDIQNGLIQTYKNGVLQDE